MLLEAGYMTEHMLFVMTVLCLSRVELDMNRERLEELEINRNSGFMNTFAQATFAVCRFQSA